MWHRADGLRDALGVHVRLRPTSDDRITAASTPVQAYFLDASLLSNIPINLFHVDPGEHVCCPTFGVVLSPTKAKLEGHSLLDVIRAGITASKREMELHFLAGNEVSWATMNMHDALLGMSADEDGCTACISERLGCAPNCRQ